MFPSVSGNPHFQLTNTNSKTSKASEASKCFQVVLMVRENDRARIDVSNIRVTLSVSGECPSI